LRREIIARIFDDNMSVKAATAKEEGILLLTAGRGKPEAVLIANFRPHESIFKFDFGDAAYLKVMDSADANWAGPGSKLPRNPVFGEECVVQSMSAAFYVESYLVRNND
jgi:hypothetical protein